MKRFGTVPILTRSEAPGPKFRGPAAFKGQLYLDSTSGFYFRARDAGRDALWDRVFIQSEDELRSFILSVGGGGGGGTQVIVDGEPVDSYSISSAPITAEDFDAYTKDEVNELISDLNLGDSVSFNGISMWDAGNVESVTRAPGFADKGLVSGRLWLQYFYAPRTSQAIVSLGYAHRTPAPASATAQLAIFEADNNDNLTKVAQTATFAPAGTYSDQVRPLVAGDGLPANYVFDKGQRYAIGVLSFGTTVGAAHGWDIPGSGNNPVISRFIEGQANIAASYLETALTDWYEGLYLFGRRAGG